MATDDARKSVGISTLRVVGDEGNVTSRYPMSVERTSCARTTHVTGPVLEPRSSTSTVTEVGPACHANALPSTPALDPSAKPVNTSTARNPATTAPTRIRRGHGLRSSP